MSESKKTLYFDMDGVLADFVGYRETWLTQHPGKSELDFELAKNIFAEMPPVEGAIEAVHTLAKHYEVFVLSTVPWQNTAGASGKVQWIKDNFGTGPENPFYKKIILTHNKHLNTGDYLIDDRPKNGADQFSGEWIQFGSARFPDWSAVIEYLLDNA